MLLDLWSFAIIVSDLVDFVVYCIDSSSFYVTFPFFVFVSLFLFICIVAWKSTNIPDTPAPPSPPYVIQIQGNGPDRNRGRQTLSDIRILSSGPYVESVLRRLPQQQNLPHGVSNRDPSEGTIIGRGQRTPSSFLFGLLRRPTVAPVIPSRPLVRSRFIAPNLIVYHRVNVYHHSTIPNRNLNESRGTNTGADDSTVAGPTAVNTPTLIRPEDSVLPSTTVEELQQELSDAQRQDENQTLEISGERFIVENSEVVPDLSLSVSGSQIDDENPQVEVEVHTEEEIALIETEEESDDLDIVRESGTEIVEPVLTSSPQLQGNSSDSLQARNVCNNISSQSVISNSQLSNQHRIDTDRQQAKAVIVRQSPLSQSNVGGEETMEPGSNDVRFTIKFLNDTQMEVTSQYSENIADFKRRHFATEMSENKVVRLIFNGRVLDNDSKTLRESGIFEQCVVHCLIVTRQTPADERSDVPHSPYAARGSGIRGRGPEPGMFFVSIMGIILIFLWFICFHFGQQLFTQSAIVSLTVLTAIFLIGLVAFYLPIHPNN